MSLRGIRRPTRQVEIAPAANRLLFRRASAGRFRFRGLRLAKIEKILGRSAR